MKNRIRSLAVASAFGFVSLHGAAQSRSEKLCTSESNCCEKESNSKQTAKKMDSIYTPARPKAVACKLTSVELQKRKQQVLASLKSKVKQKTELSNGYIYRFDGSDTLLVELINFIQTERACCNFFTFQLLIEDAESPVFLTISGPEGAKEFINTEMDL